MKAILLTAILLSLLACGSDEESTVVTPTATTDCSLKAFVTSTAYGGHILSSAQSAGYGGADGLAGADYLCNKLASEAGLSGTFVAWLSNSTSDAKDRLTSAGPWCLTNNTKVADDLSDLTDGSLDSAINRDESGNYVTVLNAWSGTQTDGTAVSGKHCQDWASGANGDKGAIGVIGSSMGAWTYTYNIIVLVETCDESLRFYCFQN